MDQLIKKLREFNRARDWEQYHSPKNFSMALMVEAAELAEHFQWLTLEESRNLPPEKLEKVKEEIADVLIYLANLADKLGIDPLAAAHEKLETNRRKYPVEKVKGKANKYSDFQQ